MWSTNIYTNHHFEEVKLQLLLALTNTHHSTFHLRNVLINPLHVHNEVMKGVKLSKVSYIYVSNFSECTLLSGTFNLFSPLL